MNFPFPSRLAIVAIIRNERPYIEEWLDYHILAGVDRFYIYDNESEDDVRSVLEPYVQKGFVVYQRWPGLVQQLNVYADALKRYRYSCQYMMFLDIDEFVVPREDKSIPDLVEEILRQDRKAAGVVMNWRMFGSSGLDKRPDSILEGFCHRAEAGFGPNEHVKVLANPRLMRYMRTPHHAIYAWGWHAVDDAQKKIVNSPFNPGNEARRLCINHYFTKSKAEWIVRRSHPRADSGTIRPLQEFYDSDRNEVYDDTAVRYRDARKRHAQGMKRESGALEPQSLLEHFLGELAAYPQRDAFDETVETLCCYLDHALQGEADDISSALLARSVSQMLSLCMKQGVQFWEVEMILELVARMNEAKVSFGQEMVQNCYQGLLQIIEHFRLEGDALQEAYYWRRTQFFRQDFF